MTCRKIALVLTTLAVLGCGTSEPPAEGDGPGSLTGFTGDAGTGDALAGVAVVVAGAAGTSGSDGRFRIDGVAGTAAVDIGSGVGQAIYIGGQLHVMVGAVLFRVD
jgi:hypothetical protein